MIQRKSSSENCSPTIEEKIKVMKVVMESFNGKDASVYMMAAAHGIEMCINILTDDNYFKAYKILTENVQHGNK